MRKRFLIILTVCLGIICILGGYAYYSYRVSNPYNAKTIGEIPLPVGYKRIPADKNSFEEYLRSLPLKPRGSKVYLYRSRKLANYQWLSAGVIDMPLLSNDEQCADVCMRLWGEYLYSKGRYNEICFITINNSYLQYSCGNNRQAFEKYMRQVYGMCNTNSLHHSLNPRELKDIQIGDIFVYPHRNVAGKDRYGHAVMVADMAINPLTGKKIVLLVEGNTPARDIHVVRNFNPLRNPWHSLDEDAASVQLNVFRFKSSDLRHF